MLSLPPLNSASWCDDQKCSWTFNTWSVSLDCVWPLTSRKPMFSFNGWMLSSGCLICGASKDQWMSNFCCLVVVTYVQWSRKLIYRKRICRSGLYQTFSARQSNVNLLDSCCSKVAACARGSSPHPEPFPHQAVQHGTRKLSFMAPGSMPLRRLFCSGKVSC